MAVELEQTIMAGIGLGSHYNWFNGSGSCEYIRRNAVDNLTKVAATHGLSVSQDWLSHCKTAVQVDQVNGGRYSLTNTWIACSYAIQDAIYRNEAGAVAGISPDNHEWQFWSKDKQQLWTRQQDQFSTRAVTFDTSPKRWYDC